jgi:hypothetical protein
MTEHNRRARERTRRRGLYVVWTVICCPAVGWLVAVLVAHGEGGVAKFIFLFIALPALLAVAGAVATRRSIGAAIAGSVASASVGALSWMLTIVWLATQGVFD